MYILFRKTNLKNVGLLHLTGRLTVVYGLVFLKDGIVAFGGLNSEDLKLLAVFMLLMILLSLSYSMVAVVTVLEEKIFGFILFLILKINYFCSGILI